MRPIRFTYLVLLTCILAIGCTPSPEDGSGKAKGAKAANVEGKTGTGDENTVDTPRLYFVTNGIANFWNIAAKGAMKAKEDFDCDVEVKMPSAEGGRAANQKRMLEQLISKGFDGIAVSPVNPENQTDILNELGNHGHFITHDSDAPDSNRQLYVGMSNYDAGRMCGELVKKAIPDGGNIVIFVGSIEQDNAKLRRQGVIDEVFGRSHDPSRYDKPGGEIKEGKYNFLATRVDDFNDTRKKELPEAALAKFEKIDCMVGLFEYNPPFIFDALESAGKMGEIKVVGFDENARTLEEIKNGNCEGTVVQNPFMYGYQSMKILAEMSRGDYEKGSEFIDIPARKIVKDNVEEFRKELESMIGE